MARIRTVKPEFLKHHELFLAEKDSQLPLRLGFLGLWLVSDKEGRFKWKPTQLKLDALPYDECDFESILIELVIRGFIVKYEVDGKEYGCIPSFKDHQRFSGSEASSESRLPAVEIGSIMEVTRKQQGSSEEVPLLGGIEILDDSLSEYNDLELPRKFQGSNLEHRKGKEGKGREGEGTNDPPPIIDVSVIYDIEKEILSNQKFFEGVCIKTRKGAGHAKDVLRKYHLWLQENSKYPKTRESGYAGFEKWLMTEKNPATNGVHDTKVKINLK